VDSRILSNSDPRSGRGSCGWDRICTVSHNHEAGLVSGQYMHIYLVTDIEQLIFEHLTDCS